MKHLFTRRILARGAYILLVLFFPLVAGAQAEPTKKLSDFLKRIGGVTTSLIAIISALALLYFVYGLARFILHAGEDEKRKEGKKAMGWGIIAMFVMVSLWGIVTLISQATLGEDPGEGSTRSMQPPVIDSGYFGGTTSSRY